MDPNFYILAADNSPALLPLLRAQPALARQQDEHGYSLVHAAASYNHLDLLRALVLELRVPVDIRDEDNETALFVVETVAAARCLVEELGLDPTLVGDEGLTAGQKIAQEAEFPQVAAYLGRLQAVFDDAAEDRVDGDLPTPPPGMHVTLGTMPGDDTGNDDGGGSNDGGGGSGSSIDATAGGAPDPELRRRIEELAARPDFHTDAGQAVLRQIVEDALSEPDARQ